MSFYKRVLELQQQECDDQKISSDCSMQVVDHVRTITLDQTSSGRLRWDQSPEHSIRINFKPPNGAFLRSDQQPTMIPATKLGLHLGNSSSPVEVEIFHDFTCPFTKKTMTLLQKELLAKYSTSVSFVLHGVVQPWHFQAIALHEVAAVVRETRPEHAWTVLALLYEHSDSFNDAAVDDLTRTQLYKKLAAFVEEKVGIPSADLLAHLVPKTVGETNAVSQARWVKNEIKHHRSRSIHVTPTVFVNGIEATQVSSGWTLEQWDGLLAPLLANPKVKQALETA